MERKICAPFIFWSSRVVNQCRVYLGQQINNKRCWKETEREKEIETENGTHFRFEFAHFSPVEKLGFCGDDEHFEFVATDSHCIIPMRTNEMCTYVPSYRHCHFMMAIHMRKITRNHLWNGFTCALTHTHPLTHKHICTMEIVESENEYELRVKRITAHLTA